ncbi:DUF6678 family protein [Marinobacter halodurans]|uniref:DUF6678 family protein n=1 Tax=Marinobacter halodurans TaxID=2528979 RepID=UPI0031015E6A
MAFRPLQLRKTLKYCPGLVDHYTFPFVGVEWFDISLQSTQKEQDTSWVVDLVKDIGFEYEVREDILRIWGYGPKSFDEFGV